MARFPRAVPNLRRIKDGPDKWALLQEFLESIFAGQSAANATPPSPTQVQAGVEASTGTSLGPANASHVHSIETAAPNEVIVGGGAPAEGTGSALTRASSTTRLGNGAATAGQTIRSNGTTLSFQDDLFTKEYVFLAPAGAVDTIIWRAPFACTVRSVKAYQGGGTSGTVNARKNGTLEHLAADLATTAGAWADTSTVQNAGYVSTDYLEMRVKTVVGVTTYITIEVSFSKA
jgi:hypothetical protein